MTSFTSKALLSKLKNAKKGKMNGFTLIELMVVVAIVGVLSAVGLPALTKAQDKAKDSATIATLTNAAKECSLSLITVGDDSEYWDADALPEAPFNAKFADVEGICEIDGSLTLVSPGREEDDTDNTHKAAIQFDGAVPQTAAFNIPAADVGEDEEVGEAGEAGEA